MTRAVRPRLALLLVALPLLALVAGRLAGRDARAPSAHEAEADLRRAAEALQEEFVALLSEGAVAAERARDEPRWSPLPPVRGPLASRLEGAGRIGRSGALETWSGSPVDPGPAPFQEGRSWAVRLQGLRARLVATSAPDPLGRRGIATFLLDGPLPDQELARLVPAASSRDVVLGVEFVERADAASEVGTALGGGIGALPRDGSAAWFAPLSSPAGEVLAVATLRPLPGEQRALAARSLGDAAAAILFALLLAAVVRWRRWRGSGRGLIAAAGAIVVARGALLAARAPARLLPRELGTATLYGSADGWGLLGSPADLLLSAIALLLLARALRSTLRAIAERRPVVARAAAILAALVATGALHRVAVSLARDARIEVLSSGSWASSAAQMVLLAGLSLAIAAAAELWSFRRARSGAARAAAVAAVPLAALAAWGALHTSSGLADDRLRSELAPQVVEQSARRKVALIASVREASASDRAADAVVAPDLGSPSYASYLLWSSGDLFHAGYQSSIDLYDVDGARRSHFGLNLPPLTERVPVPPVLESAPVLPGVEMGPLVREESFREGSLSLRLLHAEMPIFQEGRPVGTVVGHVLDEPENLPFLPGSLPYLAALGFGGPAAADDGPGAPAYVLYADDGSVVLSSLAQPPAPGPEIRAAAASGRTLLLQSGDEPYLALPLDDGRRLHLVLVPQPNALDRIATFVRLALLALGAIALLAVTDAATEGGALRHPLRQLRGSFYRKLLAALLVASVVPVVGLSLFVRTYVDRRAQAALVDSATRLVTVVKRVVEDYASSDELEDGDAVPPPAMNDEILHWLRRVAGQEIHLYQNGRIAASSKRELFSSGLLPDRLPGEAHRALVLEGLPYVVLETRLGAASIPVAYARAHLGGPAPQETVAAVPLVLERRELTRALDRVGEMLLLASVLLIVLLAGTASLLARTVARPVRELAGATRRIAEGDYETRLTARTHDEVAELVRSFRAMAEALAAQRADLERRRDYIEALLRNATTGVVSTDLSGRVVTLNPAAATLLAGGGAPPAIGDDLAVAVALRPELAPLAELLRRPPRGEGEPEEVDLKHEGGVRRLRLVRVPLPDPSGGAPGGLLLLDDVTDLMRSNQLAAWAEMARAIAHEIKNPLTPIRLSTEHLERLLRDRGLLPSPELEACIATVLKQVRTLREIAAEFSAYAKLPDLARSPTDPAELLREAVAPYRSALPEGVELRERYASTPAVPLDRRVVSRAVVNLIENALHAMPDGGVLTVETAHAPERGEVSISVSDTGSGLDPRVRERLFEPYFSTKSSGTGLGLAIVRRAVEAHRGRIEVDSELGRGSTFRLHLPLA